MNRLLPSPLSPRTAALAVAAVVATAVHAPGVAHAQQGTTTYATATYAPLKECAQIYWGPVGNGQYLYYVYDYQQTNCNRPIQGRYGYLNNGNVSVPEVCPNCPNSYGLSDPGERAVDDLILAALAAPVGDQPLTHAPMMVVAQPAKPAKPAKAIEKGAKLGKSPFGEDGETPIPLLRAPDSQEGPSIDPADLRLIRGKAYLVLPFEAGGEKHKAYVFKVQPKKAAKAMYLGIEAADDVPLVGEDRFELQQNQSISVTDEDGKTTKMTFQADGEVGKRAASNESLPSIEGAFVIRTLMVRGKKGALKPAFGYDSGVPIRLGK